MPIIALQLYVGIVVRHYVFGDEIESELIISTIYSVLSTFGVCVWARFFLNWLGCVYVKSELPRIGNETLLNDLKEGVFIIEEETSLVLFQNTKAKRFDTKFNPNYSISLVDNDGETFNKTHE